MDTFTLITGLASLFGFTIQVFDLFPKLGRARQTVFVLLAGIFLGSLIRAIDTSSIRLNVQITGFTVVCGLFSVVVISFLTAAAFSSDFHKRQEFYGVAGVGFLVFIFFLMFGGMLSGIIESPAIEKEKITIIELNALADRALQNNDLDRALLHLRTIHSRVQGDSDKSKVVKEKIRAIETQELK